MELLYKHLNSGECSLIHNNNCFIFDQFGSCIRKDSKPDLQYVSNPVKVNALSLLNTRKNTTEIAIQEVGKPFRKVEVTQDVNTLIRVVTSCGGTLRVLTKRNTLEGYRYTQNIFVYAQTSAGFDKVLNILKLGRL